MIMAPVGGESKDDVWWIFWRKFELDASRRPSRHSVYLKYYLHNQIYSIKKTQTELYVLVALDGFRSLRFNPVLPTWFLLLV